MHPQMTIMLEAQDLEKELLHLRGVAEAISIPLERTRSRRQAIRRDLIAARDKLERTTLARRQKETELKELEQKLALANERLTLARNSREAEAQQAEIEKATASAGSAEEDGLELLEKEEQLTAALEQLRSRVDRDVQQLDEEIQRLEGLLQENQDLAKGLREERIAVVNRLEQKIREHYDWLLKRYGPGQAVADTTGAACSGCGSLLLPDQAIKVNDAAQLHKCTHCGRYLTARAGGNGRA